MRKIIPPLTVLMFSCQLNAYAEIIQNEAAVEAVEFSVTHARVGGFIHARQCQQCPMLSLQIDDKTRAFANGKEVSVNTIPSQPASAVTVIYDAKSKIAKRVLW